MSIPVWTWRDAVAKAAVPTYTKALCWALANYMSDAGKACWPALETLAADAGMSERAATMHLKAAVKAGLLAVSRKRKSDGTLGSYIFQPRFPDNAELVRGPRPNEGGLEVGPPAPDAGSPPAHDDTATRTRCGSRSIQREISSSNPPSPLRGEGVAVQGALIAVPSETKRAHRLPEGFEVPDEWREWARQKAPKFAAMVDHEADQFADHHIGRGTKWTNWRRAWQTWWRNAVVRAPRQFGMLPTARDRYIDECRKSREIAAQVCAEFERGKSL